VRVLISFNPLFIHKNLVVHHELIAVEHSSHQIDWAPVKRDIHLAVDPPSREAFSDKALSVKAPQPFQWSFY